MLCARILEDHSALLPLLLEINFYHQIFNSLQVLQVFYGMGNPIIHMMSLMAQRYHLAFHLNFYGFDPDMRQNSVYLYFHPRETETENKIS